MTVRDGTKSKLRQIRTRNKLRAEFHLPSLSITEELRKMNDYEERMAFDAFVKKEYPKYKDFMLGVKGFGLNMLRDQKIRAMIWPDFIKKRRG